MMRTRILWSKAILLKFLLSLMWLNSAPVTAQGALEEVIVTAQKREESLQDVSISMTALSGDMRVINMLLTMGAPNFRPRFARRKLLPQSYSTAIPKSAHPEPTKLAGY